MSIKNGQFFLIFIPHSSMAEEAAHAGEPHVEKSLADMAKNLGVEIPKPKTSLSADILEKESSEAQKQKHSEEEGEKLVDKYSAKIQEHAEELYASFLHHSRNEPEFLEKLIDSEDAIDRKMAQKILKRNPETFGASSIDAYKILRAKEKSPSDPFAEEKMKISQELQNLRKDHEESKWQSWKNAVGVTPGLHSEIDTLHSEYPKMPFTDVLALAKGRIGMEPMRNPQKQASSLPFGSEAVPSKEYDVDPMLQRRLRITPDAEKFAREYFKGTSFAF